MKFDYPIDDEKLKVSQIRGARPSADGKRIVFTALDRLWIADLPQGRGTKKEKPAGDAGASRRPSRQAEAEGDKPAADAAQKPAAEAAAKPAPEPRRRPRHDPQRAAADDRHRRRARPGLVAGRPVHRLRHVERRRRRTDLSRSRRRQRTAGAAHAGRGVLRQARLLARRLAADRRARIEDAPPPHARGLRQSQRLRRARVRLAAGRRRHRHAHRVGRRAARRSRDARRRTSVPIRIASTCGRDPKDCCRCASTAPTSRRS